VGARQRDDSCFGDGGGACDIRQENDSIWCSRQCAHLAKRLGFDDTDVWEICIAASELVTNVLKYAGRGTLTLTVLPGEAPALEIVVEDDGPGIQDIAVAVRDGVSEGRTVLERPDPRTRRGLGAGLGAVQRLMDDVVIENRVPHGVKVTARKRAGRHNPPA
jgi:serine/threonine-protein kinase RsbT